MQELTNHQDTNCQSLLQDYFRRIAKTLGRNPNKDERMIIESMMRNARMCNYTAIYSPIQSQEPKVSLADNSVVHLEDGRRYYLFMHQYALGKNSLSNQNAFYRTVVTSDAKPIASVCSLDLECNTNSVETESNQIIIDSTRALHASIGLPIVGCDANFSKDNQSAPSVTSVSIGIKSSKEKDDSNTAEVGDYLLLISIDSESTLHDSLKFNRVLRNISNDIRSNGIPTTIEAIGDSGVVGAVYILSERTKLGFEIQGDTLPSHLKGSSTTERLTSPNESAVLAIVPRGFEDELNGIVRRYRLRCTAIGATIAEQRMHVIDNSVLIAEIPLEDPLYLLSKTFLDSAKDIHTVELAPLDLNQIPEPDNLREVAMRLINLPNLAPKNWLFQQFDSMIGNRYLGLPYSGSSGIVSLGDNEDALVFSIRTAPRYAHNNLQRAAMIMVSEAARSIACTGAKPVAGVLGIPTAYEDEAQLGSISGVYKGAKEVFKSIGIPFLYSNPYLTSPSNNAINPLLSSVGVLGTLKKQSGAMSFSFKDKGHMIYLLGRSYNDIASSEYLASIHGIESSPAPHFNIEDELSLVNVLPRLTEYKFIVSASNVSRGGLFTALIESSLPNGVGFDITTDAEIRTDAFLFGESQGRIVVSVSMPKETDFIDFMMESGVPFAALGHVTKSEIRIDDISYGYMKDIRRMLNL